MKQITHRVAIMTNIKKIIYILLLFITPISSRATHNRGGEITYVQIDKYTYEITLYTYTYTKPGVHADRPELEISWGDNTSDVVPRDEEVYLPYYYKRNRYVWRHTFPGAGTYEILAEDPNRNEGVDNIENSVTVIFAVKTILKIDPDVGYNNTPVLLNPPYDKAFVGVPFVHNPSAFDSDGDSISYRLTYCLGEEGKPLSDVFTYPEASKSLTVNAINGDLIWDSPTKTGIFNIAIAIEEWREGIKIGQIIRDMQIEVFESDNTPPDLLPIPDFCVIAGSTVEFDVVGIDKDTVFIDKTIISKTPPYDTITTTYEYLDTLTITGTGGPLMVENPAIFNQPVKGFARVVAPFRWITGCEHLRKTPYQMIFKVEDARSYIRDNVESDKLKMFDYENVQIAIVAPAPENVTIESTYNSAHLAWDAEICSNAVGYNIYRRINPSGYVPDNCEIGVPEYTGYKLISTIDGIDNTKYIDNDNGNGLLQGINYCYLITAVFADGTESYASEEVCTILKQGIPAITNVSVRHTDTKNGSIYLAWVKPIEIDTSIARGPYRYVVFRSVGMRGESFEKIASLDGLENTSLIDTMINTTEFPWSYKIEFWNLEPNNTFLVGTPQVASSTYNNVRAGENSKLYLNYTNNTPWLDTAFVIYRKSENQNKFDSVGYSKTNVFTDKNLENGQTYCYYIKAIGYYNLDSVVNPLINLSQEICSTVIDTIPPCAPPLSVNSNCDTRSNILTWTISNAECAEDIMKFKIYYAALLDTSAKLLTTIEPATINTYTHNTLTNAPFTDYITTAGCYSITAVDSFGNETPLTKRVCVDACTFYKLPNVFTPNKDTKNDKFKPIDYENYAAFIDKINLKIYNRWGSLVFETEDPAINWDGTHMNSKDKVPDGVYYYVCDVYERRISGIEPRYLIGFIQIFGDDGQKKP